MFHTGLRNASDPAGPSRGKCTQSTPTMKQPSQVKQPKLNKIEQTYKITESFYMI